MQRIQISFIFFLLISSSIHAKAECGYEIKLGNEKNLCINQTKKDHGDELSMFIIGESKKINAHNGFFVAIEKPTVGLVCWINNGELFDDSFQIVNLKTMQSIRIKVDPLPLSDELQCMVSDDEKYFLVYDNFPGRERAYVYNRIGELALRNSMKLEKKMNSSIHVDVDGGRHSFSAVHVFGGFEGNK